MRTISVNLPFGVTPFDVAVFVFPLGDSSKQDIHPPELEWFGDNPNIHCHLDSLPGFLYLTIAVDTHQFDVLFLEQIKLAELELTPEYVVLDVACMCTRHSGVGGHGTSNVPINRGGVTTKINGPHIAAGNVRKSFSWRSWFVGANEK